ncbi:phytanoyl-CoA dioxygenase family protein [Embleya sp. NBC_00896]|uniref:phytanoyl-CoA dioxygenase family protein n=1 Tax=Embleya sp. NBC_00896 TaxID=2975961 RepID=UPI0038667329|nr:phytanoyl-CoA dioxygenase family protein [Embleya sp. NBC_00896]
MLGHDRIDAETYHRDIVPGLLIGEPGERAAVGLAGLAPLGMRIGDAAWTYRPDASRLRIVEGIDDDATCVVRLSPDAWTDLVTLMRTAAALAIAGDVHAERGSVLDLFGWEPVLRALYQGIEIYLPHGPEVRDRHGRSVDLGAELTLDHSDRELADHFDATGVMRVRGVFSAAEVAAFEAEVARLAAEAAPGDDRSWWAVDEAGEDVLCRIVYASERSELIASLARDPRLVRLATLLHDDLAATTDRMEGISVLLKPPGRLKGLANIPWHTDCGLGGHHIMCPSVAIGIQLTGSSAATGYLEAIAGSHGRTCPQPSPNDHANLPYLTVPTDPGDVTVHIADVLHASPAPAGEGGRRTMYVTFQPPSLFEHVGPGEAVNDLIRSRTAVEVEAGLGL